MQDNNDISIPEIIQLPGMEDVKAELEDPRLGMRTHGNRSTYRMCNGPLCRKAEREHMRNRTMIIAMEAGRIYKESKRRMWDRDELLDEIIKWHILDMKLRRYEARKESA